MANYSSPAVALSLALALAGPATAQVNDVPQPDTSPVGSAEILKSIEQIGPREWLFRARVPDTPMSAARASALGTAAAHVAATLEVDEGSAQGDFLEKVLIIDESFEKDGYSALLRVLSSRDDPEFATAQSRETEFESNSIPEAQRPEWVMVVPADVSEDGAWDISERNSTWASKWKIPFRDGVTQFVPATFDADDRSISESSRDFDVLSEHLSDRYNAEHILYAARSETGEVLLSHWAKSGSWMGTLSAGDGIDTSNYTNLRAAVLDGFWSTYGNVHQTTSEASQGSGTYADEQQQSSASESNGMTRYRLVGEPSGAAGNIQGFLQVINNGAITARDVEDRMRRVQGLRLASVEDHGSSFLVRFQWTGESLLGLEQALAIEGFSSDLY